MNYSTTDLKLAATLCALGVPLRNPDPVTNVLHADTGDRQFIFWFEADEAQRKLAAQWTEWFAADRVLEKDLENILGKLKAGISLNEEDQKILKSLPEHPMYYIKAALENRDRLMGLMHKATPLRLIRKNGISVIYADSAPQHIKDKLKSLL